MAAEIKYFMPDATHVERIQALNEQCHSRAEGHYVKDLTADELLDRKELLSETSIQLGDLDKEKKDLLADIKARIKPVEETKDKLVKELKSKQVELYGDRYLMANHVSGMMEIYDHMGALIDERKLRPDERQGDIFGGSKMFIPGGFQSRASGE